MALVTYPQQFPTYQPAMRLVTNITNAFPAVVTTSFAHQYLSGTQIRLDVPFANGMYQMDQQFGPITVLSPTTFSIPIDSTQFDVFVIPSNPIPSIPSNPISNYSEACCVPIGELNSQLTAAVQNVLPYSAT